MWMKETEGFVYVSYNDLGPKTYFGYSIVLFAYHSVV